MPESNINDQNRKESDIEGNWRVGSDVEGLDHDKAGRSGESEETPNRPESGFDDPAWRPSDQHETDVLDESSHPEKGPLDA